MKKTKKQKGDKIFQSNKYTLSRYSYTALQKNIIYYVLKDLQEELLNETIYGNKLVYIPIKKLLTDGNKKNYYAVADAVKNLREKSIQFRDKNGNKEITGIILRGNLQTGTGIIEIEVGKSFIELIKHNYTNFTSYNLTRALTFKSVYSKKMYELVNCWKNQGGQKLLIEDFKYMLAVEEKYNRPAKIKKYILDVAKKELDDTEISFTYSLEKEGRAFKYINFKITRGKMDETPELTPIQKGQNFQYLNTFLRFVYPRAKFGEKAFNLTLKLSEEGRIDSELLKKIKRIAENYDTNKDVVRVAKKMLKEDYDIE